MAAEPSSKLLERARELTALRMWMAAVSQERQGRLALVGGEAGVGKTALVRRFSKEQPRSARILWGECDALFTPRPLGPLLDVARLTGGDLERLVDGGAKPHEVADALIRELAMGSPALVILEDLHWADEATLDVLRLLCRRIATVRALVVATYRDDELDRSHPLRVVLGDVGRGDRVASLSRFPSTRWRCSRPLGTSTPTSSTARRPGTRSSSPRRSQPQTWRYRVRSEMRSWPAPQV